MPEHQAMTPLGDRLAETRHDRDLGMAGHSQEFDHHPGPQLDVTEYCGDADQLDLGVSQRVRDRQGVVYVRPKIGVYPELQTRSPLRVDFRCRTICELPIC